MTQPQKRLGHYGALSLAALVALVLVGACETPVPSLAPEDAEEATFTVQEVEIPAPTVEGKLVPTDESVLETEEPAGVIRVREIAPGEVQSRLDPVDESALESGEPGGTLRARELPAEEATLRAFTVAPSIVNRDEVVTAMEQNYPPLLRDAGIGGTIRVMMFVSDDGTLADVRLGESSGHQALDAAALRVARTYRFAPALDGNDPVATWIQFPITFRVR